MVTVSSFGAEEGAILFTTAFGVGGAVAGWMLTLAAVENSVMGFVPK